MANRFTLDRYASDALPGFGRAFSGAVDSYESAIDRERRREREDELMAREQDELARRDRMEELRRQALGLDGVQGLVAEQQTDEMYGPAGETAFTTEDIMASGPSLVPSPEEVLAGALDQETMMSDRQDLAEAGVDTPEKKKDLAEFARVVAETPDEELAGVVQERVERGAAEGRDMRDTADLIGNTPEQVRERVDLAKMIVNREAIREMYAMDPDATRNFLQTTDPRGNITDLDKKLAQFERWQEMPEGEDKRAFGMLIGAVPRSASFEDKLQFEKDKSDVALEEFRGKQDIKLATAPQIEQSIAQARKQGTITGEDVQLYEDITNQLPAMYEVVDNLRDLADVATYTKAGRAYDAAVREMGFKVPKGATARAKYIATVNNEVLPLLKQTFGAAFTVQEGESLKATLGDPNSSPLEKQAALDAFIDQKVRQVRTLGRKTAKARGVPEDTVDQSEIDDLDAQIAELEAELGAD